MQPSCDVMYTEKAVAFFPSQDTVAAPWWMRNLARGAAKSSGSLFHGCWQMATWGSEYPTKDLWSMPSWIITCRQVKHMGQKEVSNSLNFNRHKSGQHLLGGCAQNQRHTRRHDQPPERIDKKTNEDIWSGQKKRHKARPSAAGKTITNQFSSANSTWILATFQCPPAQLWRVYPDRTASEWPEKESDDIIDSPACHPQWLLQIRLCSLGRNCTSDAPRRLAGGFIRYRRQNCNCGSLHAHRFVSPRTLDFELPQESHKL